MSNADDACIFTFIHTRFACYYVVPVQIDYNRVQSKSVIITKSILCNLLIAAKDMSHVIISSTLINELCLALVYMYVF